LTQILKGATFAPHAQSSGGFVRSGLFLAVALTVALLAGCGDDDASSSAPAPTQAAKKSNGDPGSAIDERIAVGPNSHLLALRCVGTGSPTVVLEAGSGSSGIEMFRDLQSRLAKLTTACTYDRLGTGRSDPPTRRRRTLDDVTGDLRLLVHAGHVKGPYVLVGASGGGLIAVDYAGRYPDGIAGVVLLEVGEANPHLINESAGSQRWRNPEHMDWAQAERRLARRPPTLDSIPLLVVVARDANANGKYRSAWLDLSSRSRQMTLEGTHDLYLDNPGGVVTAIRSMLG